MGNELNAWRRTNRRMLLVGAVTGVVTPVVLGLPFVRSWGEASVLWLLAGIGLVLGIVVQVVNLALVCGARRAGFTGDALRAAALFLPVLAVTTVTYPLVAELDGWSALLWTVPLIATVAVGWLLAPWCLAPLEDGPARAPRPVPQRSSR